MQLGRTMGLLAALTLALAACGSEGTSGTTTGGTTSATTGGTASVCATDPRAQPYAVGLEGAAKDGAVKIRFLDANPAPPEKGNNTFTIQVLDAMGKPINGAAITTKPFMPDHGHPSSIKPQATPKGSDGTYEINPVTLFMPGIWEITFEVTPPMGAMDAVVFTFCIDG